MQDFFLTIQNKHMGTAADCGDCRNQSRCRKQSYQKDASHEAESECGVLAASAWGSCKKEGSVAWEKGQIL